MTNRIRLLAVGLVAAASLLGPAAAVAHAQTTETTTASGGEDAGLDKFEEECVHLINEGHELSECQQSPKKFLPETNEIIWGSIFFVVVIGMLWKFAVPGMKKG